LQFFQRRDTADVVEMRVSYRNRLQRQTASLECLDDPFRFVSGIDADCLLSLFAADDTSVLLKCGDLFVISSMIIRCLYNTC
jgi:hypothetical protein